MYLSDDQLIEKYYGRNDLTIQPIALLGVKGKIKLNQRVDINALVVVRFKVNTNNRMTYSVCQQGETIGRLRIPSSSYAQLLRSVWNLARTNSRSR
jgi:hypothetical protein